MMNFLLQLGEDGQISYDFVLTAKNAVNFQKWKNWEDPDSFNYEFATAERLEEIIGNEELREKYREFVPVGSIEFVECFTFNVAIESRYEHIKPLNVPEELMNCGSIERDNVKIQPEGWTYIGTFKSGPCYVKSNDILKFEKNGLYNTPDEFSKLPYGEYQVSTYESGIVAEYRAFFYKDRLLDIRQYIGEPIYENLYLSVENILEKSGYKWNEGKGPAPIAFTFDYGIRFNYDKNDWEVEIMECHEFFSCGLYGFNDLEAIPFMLYRGYKDILKRLKE